MEEPTKVDSKSKNDREIFLEGFKMGYKRGIDNTYGCSGNGRNIEEAAIRIWEQLNKNKMRI